MKKLSALFRSNQHGMTLVEVMVAGGIVAGLAVAGMTMFKTQTTAQKTVEQNYEVMTVVSQIRTFLSNPDNCRESLPVNANGGTVNNLRLYPWTTSAQDRFVRNTILPGNVIIRSFTTDTSLPGLVAGQQTALKIVFSRGNNTLKDSIQKNIVISYTGGTPIATCYAAQNQLDSFWVKSIPDPTEIYYMAGNVGIGTADPTSKLDVTGSINLTGNVTTGPTVTIADTATNISIGSNPATNTNQTIQIGNGTVAAGFTRTVNILNSPYSYGNYVLNLGSQNYSNPSLINVRGDLNIASMNSAGVIIDTTYQGSGVTINSVQSNGWRSYLQFQGSGATLGSVGINGFDGANRLSSSSSVYLSTNGADRLVATSAGIIGIGLNPIGNGRLQVEGDIGVGIAAGTNWIRPASNSDGVGLGFLGTKLRLGGVQSNSGYTAGNAIMQTQTNADGTLLGRWGYIAAEGVSAFEIRNGGGSNPLIQLMNNAGAPMFYAHAGVGVGIGTNSPSQRLQVSGGALRVNGVATETNNGGAYLDFNSTTNNARLVAGNPSGSVLTFHTNSAGVTYERMRIDDSGRVGVNISPSYNFQVGGTAAATSFVYVSDKRLKESFQEIKNPLDKILAFHGVNFTWKDGKKKDIGFIAQEVEKIEPRLVETDKDGMKAVKYGNIVAIVVEAIKELKMLFSRHDEDIENLKRENLLLKERLALQDARMNAQDKKLQVLIDRKSVSK